MKDENEGCIQMAAFVFIVIIVFVILLQYMFQKEVATNDLKKESWIANDNVVEGNVNVLAHSPFYAESNGGVEHNSEGNGRKSDFVEPLGYTGSSQCCKNRFDKNDWKPSNGRHSHNDVAKEWRHNSGDESDIESVLVAS